MKRVLIFLALMAASSAAFAQTAESPTSPVNFEKSGNDFLRICDSSSEQVASVSGACRGYVQGVVEGAAVIGDHFVQKANPAAHFICLGSEVTVGQEYRVVVKFIKDHPEKSDKATPYLIVEAMVGAFPCKAGAK